MFYYPKSFLKLTLAGLFLVMLPLGYAFYYAAKTLDRLENQTQRAVYGAVQVTQASKSLRDLITDLERVARQYLVLEERDMLETYRKLHLQFIEAADNLAEITLDLDLRAKLGEIRSQEGKLFAALTESFAHPSSVRALIRDYEALGTVAQGLSRQSDQLIQREVEKMRTRTADAREVIFWQAVSLFPLAILVAIGLTIVITRPFQQINNAIRRMGDGELAEPVEVSGPQDLVNLGRRLDWLRLRLLELEHQKSKFLQRISHELKTPLTALREGSELLTDQIVGKLTDQQREVVGILRLKSIHLQKLIENLLNYSAAEFHRTLPRPEEIELARVVEKVAGEQRLALRARDLRLQLQGSGITLEADPEMLRVVVDNLLSNAIKYSPPGGTIIITQSVKDKKAVLEVSDQGPGVPEPEMERIFDAFYEGQTPSDSRVKGSGLGLAISRDYVTAHNGRIEVVRGGQRGAQFRVTLPLEQPLAA